MDAFEFNAKIQKPLGVQSVSYSEALLTNPDVPFVRILSNAQMLKYGSTLISRLFRHPPTEADRDVLALLATNMRHTSDISACVLADAGEPPVGSPDLRIPLPADYNGSESASAALIVKKMEEDDETSAFLSVFAMAIISQSFKQSQGPSGGQLGRWSRAGSVFGTFYNTPAPECLSEISWASISTHTGSQAIATITKQVKMVVHHLLRIRESYPGSQEAGLISFFLLQQVAYVGLPTVKIFEELHLNTRIDVLDCSKIVRCMATKETLKALKEYYSIGEETNSLRVRLPFARAINEQLFVNLAASPNEAFLCVCLGAEMQYSQSLRPDAFTAPTIAKYMAKVKFARIGATIMQAYLRQTASDEYVAYGAQEINPGEFPVLDFSSIALPQVQNTMAALAFAPVQNQ